VIANGEGKLGKRKLSNADSSQPVKKTMAVSEMFSCWGTRAVMQLDLELLETTSLKLQTY
jgi:hypothetical protein